MRLPVLSVTVPLMEPPTTCARAATGATRASSKKTEHTAGENKLRTKEVKVVSCRWQRDNRKLRSQPPQNWK
jgi:hypothetical protein